MQAEKVCSTGRRGLVVEVHPANGVVLLSFSEGEHMSTVRDVVA